MGSRNKRINSVLSDLDEIKRRQILSEISSIRIQSLIAILTVIGSAIAFMVIQRENISKIFKKEPALSYITNEQFVKTNGVLKIMDVNEKVVLKIDFRNLNKEFDLPSGSYTTKLIVNADTIWNESFVLKDNEHRKVV